MAQTGQWMGTSPVDMLGRPIKLDDRVARAEKSGQAVNMRISKVTRVENGKIYLDESKTAVWYPGRLLVVNEVPGVI